MGAVLRWPGGTAARMAAHESPPRPGPGRRSPRRSLRRASPPHRMNTMQGTPANSPQYVAQPGDPYPLGATWDGEGVNFALYSEKATKGEPCLFDADGNETRVPLREQDAFVWHGYVAGGAP